MKSSMSLSIITTTDPLTGHLPALLSALSELAVDEKALYEVVIVDDLQQWQHAIAPQASQYENLVINPVTPSRQSGQLSAILKGISVAQAPLLLTIDPDLYPCVPEIPDMLKLLNNDTHAVHAVRTDRSDASLMRLWGSRIVNHLVGRITRLHIDDIGSPVSLFKKEILTLLPSSEEEQKINPRLLCYFKLGNHLASYTLTNGPAQGKTSHYNGIDIARTTWRLIQNALKLRKIINNP